MAEVSLTSGKPENVQSSGNLVQDEVKRKVALLHGVQRSLDNDGFILMAQPIVGLRGDRYYEILLRMLDDQGTQYRRMIFCRWRMSLAWLIGWICGCCAIR